MLEFVRGHFTTPTFRTFAALVTGLIAQTGRCTVTGMLAGAGLTRTWSHDRAHAFFSRAPWKPDLPGIALSHLIVRRLPPEDGVSTVAVDDTLFKRQARFLPIRPYQPTDQENRAVQQAWTAASAA
ncbi:transposase [Kitasatospora sp. NPDC056138]|uniref:transposase n=1 Tax=Kitasatospora sp. NPDC056138 TaxID=3345724 RepID=UPI0035D581D7